MGKHKKENKTKREKPDTTGTTTNKRQARVLCAVSEARGAGSQDNLGEFLLYCHACWSQTPNTRCEACTFIHGPTLTAFIINNKAILQKGFPFKKKIRARPGRRQRQIDRCKSKASPFDITELGGTQPVLPVSPDFQMSRWACSTSPPKGARWRNCSSDMAHSSLPPSSWKALPAGGSRY